MLVTAAERLSACLRDSDTAARLGGDEFAVLLEDVDLDHARVLAARINEALRAPHALEGREVVLAGSVGIAASVDGAEAAEDLLRNADVAMYAAKQRGKGRSEAYEETMRTAVVERLGLEAELRRALEREELVVHYQPTVELDTGRIAGVEALVRWQHPTRGLVPPLQFIPLAEDTGLVVPLGWWVLETACRQARAWRDAYPHLEDFSVSVNLAARQLAHPDLLTRVARALGRSGLPPKALVVEITETAMMADVAGTSARLAQLKALGVQIAVDDFGTGYSSLGYLQRFPIDVLKVDKTFVDGVGGDGDASALAEAILGLARSLRLRTVAEGIEQGEQVAPLRALGCALGQGYHFSRPLDAERAGALLAAAEPLVAAASAAVATTA